MAAQPAARLWRYDVNMTDGTHTERCLGQRMLDFPSVHPAFLGQSGCTQSLYTHDLLKHSCQAGTCIHELLGALACRHSACKQSAHTHFLPLVCSARPVFYVQQ